MRFTVQTKVLKAAVKPAATAAGRAKEDRDVEAEALVRVDDGVEILAGTLTRQARARFKPINASDAASGACMVNARRLAEIVGALAGDTATVAHDATTKRLTLKSAGASFAIDVGSNPQDRPRALDVKGAAVDVAAGPLLQALSVGFSCGDEVGRAFVRHVLLRRHGDGLVTCATNGHRMTMWTGKIGGLTGLPASGLMLPWLDLKAVVLPALTSVAESSPDATVALAIGENGLELRLPGLTVTVATEQADGYPAEMLKLYDTGRAAATAVMRLGAADLLESVERVGTLGMNAIDVALSEREVRLSEDAGADYGSALDCCDGKLTKGRPIAVTLGHPLLREALAWLGDTEIEVSAGPTDMDAVGLATLDRSKAAVIAPMSQGGGRRASDSAR